MANWGVLDYDPDEVIDYTALWNKIRIEDPNALLAWPYEGPAGFDYGTVRRYCVDTAYAEVKYWQRVRLSMKGKPTHVKLSILMDHWKANWQTDLTATKVQVFNYLGALRRGGQLNDKNQIRKYI